MLNTDRVYPVYSIECMTQAGGLQKRNMNKPIYNHTLHTNKKAVAKNKK